MNQETLQKLQHYCIEHSIQRVISSHSGILDVSHAFTNAQMTLNWKEKGFQFIADAPDDPFI